MADTISPERRSLNMSAIKSKDTKPEVYLRKLLYHQGFRYRKNYSGVFGHPDIYLPKYKVAIFVHGCYWHRHSGCQYAYMPKSRVDCKRQIIRLLIKRTPLISDVRVYGIFPGAAPTTEAGHPVQTDQARLFVYIFLLIP